jgi:hypothetical protein
LDSCVVYYDVYGYSPRSITLQRASTCPPVNTRLLVLAYKVLQKELGHFFFFLEPTGMDPHVSQAGQCLVFITLLVYTRGTLAWDDSGFVGGFAGAYDTGVVCAGAGDELPCGAVSAGVVDVV